MGSQEGGGATTREIGADRDWIAAEAGDRICTGQRLERDRLGKPIPEIEGVPRTKGARQCAQKRQRVISLPVSDLNHRTPCGLRTPIGTKHIAVPDSRPETIPLLVRARLAHGCGKILIFQEELLERTTVEPLDGEAKPKGEFAVDG